MIVKCVPKPAYLPDKHWSRGHCSDSYNMERRNDRGVGQSLSRQYGKGLYMEAVLAKDTAAFFFSSCSRKEGFVTPIRNDERIYVIREGSSFPAKLSNLVIKLRERGIWVVQSQLRATLRVNAFIQQPELAVVGFATAHKAHTHSCPALSSLPNSSDDRHRTFERHRDESPLCRLLLDHPDQIRRYVSEGVFYSGFHPPSARIHGMTCDRVEVPPVQNESVFCSFCDCKTTFDSKRVSDYLVEGQGMDKAKSGAEDFLYKQTLHQPSGCVYRDYPDAALVQVRDAQGCDLKTQMFFLFNPAQESDSIDSAFSHGVCSYTRLFVVDNGQQSNSLFISHEEMDNIIDQQREQDVAQLRAEFKKASEALDHMKEILRTW